MKKIVLINLCVCLLFILCSCDRQIQKDRNDTPQIADNKLKDGKSLGFSAEKDRIDFVAIIIPSNSDNGFHRAQIHDNEGIEATIQALKNMEVYPKDESYQYYGGDTPYAKINFSEIDKLCEICELYDKYKIK